MIKSLTLNSDMNQDKSRRLSVFRRGFFIYLIIVLMISSFGVGVIIGEKKGTVRVVSYNNAKGEGEYGEVTGKASSIPAYLGKEVDFKVFWELWNSIQTGYIDAPMGETQLFYGALRGLVSSLNDPYSAFLEPVETDEFYEELSGKFEGIGAEIGLRHEVLTVVSPLSGSPAEQAGLRAGDVILAIDEVNTLGMDVGEAVRRIRGKKGSQVILKIYREKAEEFLDIVITRDEIKIVSVKLDWYDHRDYDFLGNKTVAHIEVTHFNSDTSARFLEAVNQILLKNPDAIVLDLRSNPGGYLETAVEMANYWVAKGRLVVIEKGDQTIEHQAESEPALDKFKTVVLINGGSASSSEIVAGALQDYGLAALIGENTFGKGSVQKMEELSDGSSVKLTFARWLTPSGRQIDGEGIAPDIEVERTVEDYDNDQDPQLERAMQWLVKGE